MQRTAAKWALFALALVVPAGATLTSGTVDPNGNGWLSLTGNTTNQAGFAGSIGGQTNYHEIRGLKVLPVQNVHRYATALVMSVMNGFLLITDVGLRQKGAK